jgi:hypothetical protein
MSGRSMDVVSIPLPDLRVGFHLLWSIKAQEPSKDLFWDRLKSQTFRNQVKIQPSLPRHEIEGDPFVVLEHQAPFTHDEGEARWSIPISASKVIDIVEIIHVSPEGNPADTYGTRFQASYPETVGLALKQQLRLAPTGPHHRTGGVQGDADGAAGGLSLSLRLSQDSTRCQGDYQNQGQS